MFYSGVDQSSIYTVKTLIHVEIVTVILRFNIYLATVL